MKAGRLVSTLVPFAAWLGAQACVTDNPAAYEGILGPARKAPEGPETPSGGGGTASSGGGTGAVATGGSAPSAGGAPGGEGGMGEGGEGATGGSGGTRGGSGGSGGKGGSSGSGSGAVTGNPPEDPNFSPACFNHTTTTGEEILKGTPCTSADVKLCYRPCGPHQVGWKTETCTAGVYAEGDCTFPDYKDYSCYAIANVIDEAACRVTAPPAATEECGAPECMACNFGGFYQDTGNDAKEGYCVCREPDEGGVRRWTCASVTAWPCPFSRGC